MRTQLGEERLLVAFLGQCHTVGYEGVPADASFPQVCRNVLQAARPTHRVDLTATQYHHPGELPFAVRTALQERPRVVVIEVVGWLAVSGSSALDLRRLPRPIRSAVQRVRHFRRASQEIARKTESSGLIHHVETSAIGVATGLLRPLLPRLPRPTLAEYEACVDDALQLLKASGVAAVVQGPGAGNFAAMSKALPGDAVERYRGVYEMARRVAEKHEALFVDRWDTVSQGFFIPGTTRPTLGGHSMWGHLLADHLLRAGIV